MGQALSLRTGALAGPPAGGRRTCVLLLLAVSALAQTRPRPPQVVNVRPQEADIKNAVVTPQPLEFVSSDPDLGGVPSKVPATVTWEITGAHSNGTWTLTVGADSPAFANCGPLPLSAVTVTCTTATGDGHGGAGRCGAPFQLSNQPQTVASGSQGHGNAWFTVAVSFTFQDGWQYIAAMATPCTLNLNYVIEAS